MIRSTESLLRLFAALLLSTCAMAALAARAPDFPSPPEARVEWVSRDMEINGIPSEVRAFYSRQSVKEVRKFYRRTWAKGEKGGPGFTETDAMKPWLLLTRVEDGYLMTMQVQKADRGGSWGYLARSKLPNPKDLPAMGENVPSMRGSRVMNDVKTRDPGQKGRTVLIANRHSLSSNINFYRNHYLNDGWTLDIERSLDGASMHMLAFKRRLRQVRIMIMGDHQQTRVVINAVARDIL